MREICRSTRRRTASTSMSARVSTRSGKRRQRIRELEIEIAAPKSHQADERFAFARRALARARKLRRQFGVEGLLARLIELVHGAGFAQALGKLGGGLGRGLRLRQKSHQLARGDGAVVGAARLRGDPQRFFGGAQLRLAKARRRDLGHRRQGREREHVGDQLALDFGLDRAGDAKQRERWTGRKARSDPAGFGNGELVVGGLQAAVVQERDLHRRVRRQGPAQQAHHDGARVRRIIRCPDRARILVEVACRDIGDRAHPAVGREPRTAGQQDGAHQKSTRSHRRRSAPRHTLIEWVIGFAAAWLRARLRGWRRALVLLAPGGRGHRALAGVGAKRRSIADPWDGRTGIGRIRARERRGRRLGTCRQQQARRCGCGKPHRLYATWLARLRRNGGGVRPNVCEHDLLDARMPTSTRGRRAAACGLTARGAKSEVGRGDRERGPRDPADYRELRVQPAAPEQELPSAWPEGRW